jgi:CubicO group peptidase (beta-lactamase class C family)
MKLVLAAVLVSISFLSARAATDAVVVPAVDRIAKNYLTTTPLVGFGVTVVRNGVVIHDAGYGKSRLSPPAAADANTRFDYFSVGKHVTVALVMRLAERGLVDLDSLAGKYLPGLDSIYAQVPLRQLLSHTSGTTADEIDESKPDPEYLKAPTRASLLALLAKGQRVARPGATWTYNSDGFVVAAVVAEQITGKTYEELIQHELARPLGLHDFGFQLEPNAQGYLIEAETPEPIQAVPYEWFSGAGSVRGTTRDLARWWMALRAGRVVSQKSLTEMWTPARLTAAGGQSAEFGYGLGIRLGRYAGHPMVGHTGDAAGGSAVLAEYPDDSLLIVVATNTVGGKTPYATAIQAAIARELLGIEATPPFDRATPQTLLEGAPGMYANPDGTFCVSVDAGSLFISYDGTKPRKLMHQGDGIFRRAESVGAEDYFLGGPGSTGWLAYRWYGFPMDVAMRTADACP